MRARSLFPYLLATTLVAAPVCVGSATRATADEVPEAPDAVPHSQAEQDLRLTSPFIARAIERHLQQDRSIRAARVDVEVVDGVAILSGIVDTLLGRKRAVETARATRGVSAVVDKIQVVPPTRPDEAVTQDLEMSLHYDPAIDPLDVVVAVDRGVATLRGTVEAHAERELAETVSAGVLGVREVVNEIKVLVPDSRPDEQLEAEVRRRLNLSLWIAPKDLIVTVEDGAVSVRGRVGSASERMRIYEHAFVDGVRTVSVEELEVDPSLIATIPRSDRPLTSEMIADAVERALLYDPRVRAGEDLEIEVEDREVVLTGTVPDLRSRLLAAEDAENAIGVRRVQNHLRVRPSTSLEDPQIEAAVRDALRRDPFLAHYGIDVLVRGGHAYLHGAVQEPWEQKRARRIAASAEGVVAVYDRIDPPQPIVSPPDAELRRMIQETLCWNADLAPCAITVTAEDGVVTLTGDVPNRAQARRAVIAARISGARRVVDRMTIPLD